MQEIEIGQIWATTSTHFMIYDILDDKVVLKILKTMDPYYKKTKNMFWGLELDSFRAYLMPAKL